MIPLSICSHAGSDLLNRRPNIYFNITSPTPGTFIIALHYKGREKAILEMDLKIDDLLEKVEFHFFVGIWIISDSPTAKGQQTSVGPRIRSTECPKSFGIIEESFR